MTGYPQDPGQAWANDAGGQRGFVERWGTWGLVASSGGGLLVAGYLLHLHARIAGNPRRGLCTFTDLLSCDRVLASPYAEIGGVPVALIGLAGFGGLCLLGWWRLRWGARGPEWLPGATVLVAGVGLLFETGMTGIEFFVIGALCPYCLTAFGLIGAAFVSALMVWRGSSGVRLREAAHA
jgi:uncharacterized membrane protein